MGSNNIASISFTVRCADTIQGDRPGLVPGNYLRSRHCKPAFVMRDRL